MGHVVTKSLLAASLLAFPVGSALAGPPRSAPLQPAPVWTCQGSLAGGTTFSLMLDEMVTTMSLTETPKGKTSSTTKFSLAPQAYHADGATPTMSCAIKVHDDNYTAKVYSGMLQLVPVQASAKVKPAQFQTTPGTSAPSGQSKAGPSGPPPSH